MQNTSWRLEIVAHKSLLVGPIPKGSIDDVRFYIRPEDGLAGSVPVESHSWTNACQRQHVILIKPTKHINSNDSS